MVANVELMEIAGQQYDKEMSVTQAIEELGMSSEYYSTAGPANAGARGGTAVVRV